ncbi:radical SAM/SPASM domain-containing protein [Sporofaciens musculi]|uniref:radical SAM/SPASM domain-containing protein n=1 Tax=Sporofaciens musculi TaxID=2681861 RepID=UPI0025A1B590|nr:radical SAM/SPASM domain-containing protein [Sporofaciens musculi]
MIVNRYESEPYIELHTYTADTFVLWNVGKLLKRLGKKELYEDFRKWIQKRYLCETIKRETDEWLKKNYDGKNCPVFSSIEIEVINRCNGECPFCPVNKHTDPRKLLKMDEKLFRKIIDELGELNYSGRLALHSNNEPFLDSRIIEFAKYAREKVPKAFLYMYTNGTLLTIEKFNAIIPYLDRIVIDNYNDDLKLHENAKNINDLCKNDRKLDKKVEIHVRKIHEVLDTRGGQSPNNNKRKTYNMSCILPYKQMIIRPDGKTSLCCNDPYGKYTLADVNKMSLREAWHSKRAEKIRHSLRKNRAGISLCRFCDTIPGPRGY